MKENEIKKLWEIEEEKSFIGWDFSYLEGRTEEEELPWSYKNIVCNYLEDEHNLLDMGTGGGEFLLKLEHPYNKTHVTEAYLPNLKLCKARLGILGIDVNKVLDDDKLPFDDESMDIVINRHESFDIKEVYRVLKKKGVFITQQVGTMNNLDLSKFLLGDNCRIINEKNTLEFQIHEAENCDFKIVKADEYYPKLKFYDVGALVYFAKIIEWEFPGFSVDNNFEQLVEIQKVIDRNDFISSEEHRFIIVTVKE